MELFGQLESQYGLPSGLLDAVWAQESSRGKDMLSPKGAAGHMGFMPATAKQYGVQDPNDLTQAATGAARMYADLLRQNGGDLSRALAGYNWGSGNLARKGLDAAPIETRDYIQKVTGAMGQPQARASQADAPSDDWAALAQQFAPGAVKQAAEEPDAWAELGTRFAQPAAAAASSPRAAPAAAPAQGPGFNAPRHMLTSTIPFVGPALAALNINPDAPAILKGLASGFADVGNAIINRGTKLAADALPTNPDVQYLIDPNVRRAPGQAMSPAEQANAERAKSLDAFNRDNAGNGWFTGGRLAGNVAATYPVGGALAAPLRGIPLLAPLAESVATGGFRTGLAPSTLAGSAGNLALRSAGGGGDWCCVDGAD